MKSISNQLERRESFEETYTYAESCQKVATVSEAQSQPRDKANGISRSDILAAVA